MQLEPNIHIRRPMSIVIVFLVLSMARMPIADIVINFLQLVNFPLASSAWIVGLKLTQS